VNQFGNLQSGNSTFQRTIAMSAILIDGLALAKQIRADVAIDVQSLVKQGCTPKLVVVLVGADAASQVYVRNKIKACAECGIASQLIELPADTTQAALLATVEQLNSDSSVHGILVQLPLPAHLNSHMVIEAIDEAKDVDGFHVANAGALMVGKPMFKPCTPYGVMKMLAWVAAQGGPALRGAEAVVVGASNIVGKPQAMLLLQEGATITICNSKTRDLAAQTRRADVLVVATGKAKMITGDMIKKGAVVIDVGINRLPDGKLCGDVDFDSAKDVAGFITPVPGGVGPMTIAMLLTNTLEAAQRTLKD
jgi:methylenetetrahydrofolate dehydrogenase (NADP+) / methenyltetrahydrofolate cyclohydrolase